MEEGRTALKKIKKLHDEVLGLLMERDRMTYFESKSLQIRYNEALEGLPLKLQRLQIDAMKLRFEFAAVESGSTREEAQRLAEEELYQDELFYEMQLNLKDPRASLSEDETEELEEIYEEILEILNPDLNPYQTLDTASLFITAASAYEYCQKDALAEVLKEARTFKTPNLDEMTSAELSERQKTLKTARGQIRTMIEDMEDEFPFDKADMLEDEDELEKEKAHLKESIEAMGALVEQFKEKLSKA